MLNTDYLAKNWRRVHINSTMFCLLAYINIV